MNKRKLIYFIILVIPLMAIINFLDISGKLYYNSLVNGLISLLGLFYFEKKGISLNKVYLLFNFFFFSVAPIVQYYSKVVFYTANLIILDEMYDKASFILLISTLLYLLCYMFFITFFETRNRLYKEISLSLPFKSIPIYIYYILSLLSIFLYLYLIDFKVIFLIFRPFSYDLKNNSKFGTIGYALISIIKYIPYFCVMVYAFLNSKINNKHFYALLIICLIALFPSSLPRGIVAILYIPVVLFLFPFFIKRNNFIWLMLLGLLVVFPLFNNFRYLSSGRLNFNYQLFSTAHFDAFQNFLMLLEKEIVTNGRQLLGGILFFVPESIWQNRPMGSGHVIAELSGYNYLNVTMPWVGEAYINWGYIGIGLYISVISFFNALLDFLFKYRTIKDKVLLLFYFLFMGWEFVLLRGDFYNSTKILVSLISSILILCTVGYLSIFVIRLRNGKC